MTLGGSAEGSKVRRPRGPSHPQRRDKVSNILCASYLALGTLQCRHLPTQPPTHSLGGPSWASPA